jgi:hypothetical protein
MWLSPTTAGGIVYGLAGKPSAPDNMVYLGVVKRVQSNNGSVYVHVQNGFELEELHNVSITSPANNNVLAYDSATSLWKNETAAQAGLSVVGHVHSGADITSGALDIARGGTGGTTGSGWIPITPTSVTGGGTRTINADGSVTLTSATNVVFNGVFTSAYRNYKVIFTSSGSSNTPNYILLRFASGGTVNTTTNYQYVNWYIQATGGTASSAAGNPNANLQTSAAVAYAQDLEMTFYAPQLSRSTNVYFTSVYNYTNFWGEVYFAATTAFDGFQLLNNTYGGVVRIYGLL